MRHYTFLMKQIYTAAISYNSAVNHVLPHINYTFDYVYGSNYNYGYNYGYGNTTVWLGLQIQL